MKTAEEIKKGLALCASGDCPDNGICPYEYDCLLGCGEQQCRDALAYIEQLEAEVKHLQDRIDLVLIQMRGDCGCCKYNSSGIMNRHGVYGDSNKCFECLDMWNGKPETYHPLWEYEGLPGDEQTEGKNHETG